MGMGMMIAAGALGGVGSSMTNEAALMAKDEDRVKDDASWKAREEWRMKTAATYQIAAEDRAVQRGVEKDDRDWKNEQTRAPVKREMKVADETATAAGKLDFTTKNQPAISAAAKAEANAKQSDADVAYKDAATDSQKANAEYTRGAKTEATEAKAAGGGKDDPREALQLKAIQKRASDLQKLIDEGMAGKNGVEWAPDKNPAQRDLQTELATRLKQERDFLSRPRTGGPAGDTPKDRLKLRMTDGGPDTQGNSNGPQGILNQEYAKAHAALTSAKTDEERSRASTDIANLEKEAKTRKIALLRPGAMPAAATPPVPAAARPAPPKLTPMEPPSAGADMMLLNKESTAYADNPLWRRMNPAKADAIDAAKARLDARYRAMRERDLAGE